MLVLNLSPVSYGKVTQEHFGANYLTHIDSIDDPERFSNILKEIGVRTLRFPGGGITENAFDVRNWDARTSPNEPGKALTPTSEFLQFSIANDLNVAFVIPTRKLLDGDVDGGRKSPRSLDTAEIDATLDFIRILFSESDDQLPQAKISTLEIGNEYWLGGEMTSQEYGIIVNSLVPRINQLFSEMIETGELATDFVRPKMIVQVGQPWSVEFQNGGFLSDQNLTFAGKIELSNLMLLDQIETSTRSLIDGVSFHYYYKKTHADDFAFSGGKDETRWLETYITHWNRANGFDDLEYHITEWNVQTQNVSQLGLSAVSTNLKQLEYMLKEGVDSAQIWALTHNTSTNLYGNGGLDFATIQGTGFKFLADAIVGSDLIQDNISFGNFEISVFRKEAGYEVLASLRSEDSAKLELDVSEILTTGSSLTTSVLSVDRSSSDGWHFVGNQGKLDAKYYFESDVQGYTKTYSSFDVLSNGKNIVIDLDPFEVARFSIVPGGTGINVSSQSNNLSDGSSDILAEDIRGTNYQDFVNSGAGNDTVNSLSGNDIVWGGMGDDKLVGGSGNDRLHGESGNDLLLPGEGNDTVFGGTGSDTVSFGDSNAGVSIWLGEQFVEQQSGSTKLNNIENAIGSNFDDVICGSYVGSSHIWGLEGDDDLRVYAGDQNKVWGGKGNDLIRIWNGISQVVGGPGDDKIFSFSQGVFLGGEGNDRITCIGSADDQIDGGIGNDTMTGGDGNDTFYFNINTGHDRIEDFNLEHDRIAFLSNSVNPNSLSFVSSEFGTTVFLSETASVELAGIFIEELSDLVFEV